ncbi:MAG: hypothetical protein U1F36_01415 [Planctomycetota bacterium]
MHRVALALSLLAPLTAQDDGVLRYIGASGPGAGKRIVLIAGDEEYRSEESMPMLARILAVRFGFDCEVLFHVDPKSGAIDPNDATHVVHPERIDGADLVVLDLRFRRWSDEDMRHLVDHVAAGRAVFGIRTATHAFRYAKDDTSPYADWSFDRDGGFGRRILGETWVAHHGEHGRQGTRGVVVEAFAAHPVLRGVRDVHGPTDVYAVRDLPADARVLLRGAVVEGLDADAKPVEGKPNDPMMPLFWLREIARDGAAPMRVACSTIGSADDLVCGDLRRLFVNTCLWCTGRAESIRADACVDPVGGFRPSHFGFGGFVPGVKPQDLALPAIPPRSRD